MKADFAKEFVIKKKLASDSQNIQSVVGDVKHKSCIYFEMNASGTGAATTHLRINRLGKSHN